MDGYGHRPEGYLDKQAQRLVDVERRLGSVPPRLRIGGSDVWSGQSGTTAERDTLLGVPTTDAERAFLANNRARWFNRDLGWTEGYFAATGVVGLTVTGLLTGHPSGWYPLPGSLITAHRGRTAGNQTTGVSAVEVIYPTAQILKGGIVSSGSSALTVPYGGIYQSRLHGYFAGATAMTIDVIELRVNGTALATARVASRPASTDADCERTTTHVLTSGAVLTTFAYANAASNIWGTTGYNGTFTETAYIGPPLANG